MEALRAEIVARVEALEGGWCKASVLSGVERGQLWRAFKQPGRNPSLRTLMALAPAIGVKVTLTPM
jgi:DNA-binding phage protein